MKRLQPMLATIGSELPSRGDWVFEPKYDGIRILAFADQKAVALVSRNGADKTRQFPEIAEAVRERQAIVKRPFVIDGEVVALHGKSVARFQNLQQRVHVTDTAAIAAHQATTPAAFFVFDILLDGKTSLIEEPWHVRREHLESLFETPNGSDTMRITGVAKDGARMLRAARRRGEEGIIAKRVDAPYHPGKRSRDWLKLKIEHRQEFVIGGWTEPRRTREHLGALLLGYYDDDGAFVYAGHTGTGFTRATLADLHKRLKPLERKRVPFTTTPRSHARAHWVKPELVAEVKFNEWTSDGRLRQPVFLGLRDDKTAREVIAEPESLASRRRSARGDRVRARPAKRAAASVLRKRRTKRRTVSLARSTTTARTAERVAHDLEKIEAGGGDGTLSLATGPLVVSNLGKVFFPVTGTTKGDLMRYYARIAPYLLPAIADRPLVMKRYPNGVRGPAFYQQRAPATVPEGVRVETVSDRGYAAQRKIIAGNLATILYVVQLGAISIDPWHSRVQSIPFADYAIIDLDPGPRAPFSRVVEVALAVNDVIEELGLHAVARTSGATGMHIALPLPANVRNETARELAQHIATHVAEAHPRIATVARSVSARPKGAIYVDYLQNIRGKTLAGVYSVRAQPTPVVATPLRWNELRSDLDPRDFTIDSVLERVRDVGDLWGKAMRRPNRLDRVMAHV